MTFPRVIAGLDPAIHPAKPREVLSLMDARVEPAHDGVRGEGRDPTKEIAR
jgi:hypothetical protein